MKTKYEVIEVDQAEITVDVSLLSKTEEMFFNAMQMAKPFGKRPNDFWKQPQNEEYLEALITLTEGNKNRDNFVQTKRGKYGGTYFHNDPALQFARWLSQPVWVWGIHQGRAVGAIHMNYLSKRQYSGLKNPWHSIFFNLNNPPWVISGSRRSHQESVTSCSQLLQSFSLAAGTFSWLKNWHLSIMVSLEKVISIFKIANHHREINRGNP